VNFLLDTCVLSELTRPRPDADVARWLTGTSEAAKFVSIVSLAEIQFGMLCARDAQKRVRLEEWYDHMLRPSFADRVIAFDETAGLKWAELRAKDRNVPVLDAQIAATALTRGLTLVTRNVKDFAFEGLSVFNPWRK
jgi:predicted nucleic acid-binding protein